MTNDEQFAELHHLEDEAFVSMELLVCDGLLNQGFEAHVTGTADDDTGEEIGEETRENIGVLSNNLGDVEITESTEQNGELVEGGLGTTERTGDDQHGLDSTKSPIVMSSLGEQVTAKEIELGELTGENLGLHETLGHEHVFANKLEIGHHDSDGTEKGLKTFRKLGTT
jgi:hypothetical protein